QENAQPADVRALLTGLRHGAGDDVLDQLGIDLRALGESLQGVGQELLGARLAEGALAFAEGGADGFKDDRFRHGGYLPGHRSRERARWRIVQGIREGARWTSG